MSAHPDDPRFDIDGSFSAEPDRTSALAIVSLILACTCVLSPLGFLGGIASFALISSSRGRVGGRGLAVAAIVLGGLLSMGLVGAGVAVRSGIAAFEQQLAETTDLFGEIEAGDIDAVKARFEPGVAERITPERVMAFRDAYQAEYGSFVSVPSDIGSYIESFGQMQQSASGGGPPRTGSGILPVQMTFENGGAIGLLVLAQQAVPGSGTVFPPLVDLVVIVPDGSELSLANLQLVESGGVGDAVGEAIDAAGDAADAAIDGVLDEPAETPALPDGDAP